MPYQATFAFVDDGSEAAVVGSPERVLHHIR